MQWPNQCYYIAIQDGVQDGHQNSEIHFDLLFDTNKYQFNYITMQNIIQIQNLIDIALNQDGVQDGRRKVHFRVLILDVQDPLLKQYRKIVIYKGSYIPTCLS